MRNEDIDSVDLIGAVEEALIKHIAEPDVEPPGSFIDTVSGAETPSEYGDISAIDELFAQVEITGLDRSTSPSGIPHWQQDEPTTEIDIGVKPPDWTAPAIPIVRPPLPDDAPEPAIRKSVRRGPIVVALIGCALAGILGWQMTAGPGTCRPPDSRGRDATSSLAAEAVARRIIAAESGGDAIATNARSTATGAGQFLEATWLEMIQRYRPDLSRGNEAEILELRHDPDLSREMVSRFAEKNAKMLLSRCLPVTPGTLYLSHFAGGGGAVAVLSADEDADAAATMAMADSTGNTTRSMIVSANPFLRSFTVADLKQWAEAKMWPPEGQSQL